MMKEYRLIPTVLFVFASSFFDPVYSQEDNKSNFNVTADIYSNYIWRGTKFGTGPAFQPSVEYTVNKFTVGGWSSVDFSGYQEADLYFSFSLPAGFSLGMTDYYYPNLKYFDYSGISGSHAFEVNLGFSKANLNLSANYILNEAGGAGSLGGDKYFEAEYSFKEFSFFVGAGDGWHIFNPVTEKNKFAVCNLGIETSKVIKVTDSFSIPVTGQVVFNPDKERLYILIGFTL